MITGSTAGSKLGRFFFITNNNDHNSGENKKIVTSVLNQDTHTVKTKTKSTVSFIR